MSASTPPAELSPAQQALAERYLREALPWAQRAGFIIQAPDGRLVGPFGPSLESPEISARFWDYQVAEGAHTTLSERERQIIILAVGAVWQADYELYAHSAAAASIGMAPAEVDALCRGQMPPGLSARERCAWRCAHALTAERQLDRALHDAAVAELGTRGLVDLVHLVGAYQTVCGLLNAFAVPVPEHA